VVENFLIKGGCKSLTDIKKTPNTKKNKQILSSKIQSQKGNSPNYKVRSLKI